MKLPLDERHELFESNLGDGNLSPSLLRCAPLSRKCRCYVLDLANDIRSLSDFERNTLELLERLRETGHPLVLTVNGKAELVVQDATAYQALLDRVEAMEGIQRGLAAVKAGRAFARRRTWKTSRRSS